MHWSPAQKPCRLIGFFSTGYNHLAVSTWISGICGFFALYFQGELILPRTHAMNTLPQGQGNLFLLQNLNTELPHNVPVYSDAWLQLNIISELMIWQFIKLTVSLFLLTCLTARCKHFTAISNLQPKSSQPNSNLDIYYNKYIHNKASALSIREWLEFSDLSICYRRTLTGYFFNELSLLHYNVTENGMAVPSVKKWPSKIPRGPLL